MATTFVDATDAILSKAKVGWDANSPALNGGTVPVLVYEALEPDLKPHPRDSTKPWARAVVRHNEGAGKVTLNNAEKVARYRRTGLLWVQVFVPAGGADQWTLGQKLAQVALDAVEGKRAGSSVVFLKCSIQDRPRDGNWLTFDVKAGFYWDQIK